MATRSNIAIVLNENDRYAKLNFLSERFNDVRPQLNQFDDDSTIKPEDTYIDVCCNELPDGPYTALQIYCHNDGYPDHMLTVLQRYYNTYEKALALVLAGSTSSIGKNTTVAYAIREGYNKSCNLPRPMEVPTLHQDYLYVFKDGEWTCSGY